MSRAMKSAMCGRYGGWFSPRKLRAGGNLQDENNESRTFAD